MKYIVHTDGGARGNPGPAAIGVVIEADGETIASFGMRIGETTNNVAEYTAVIEALRWLRSSSPINPFTHQPIHFYLDSNLVVQQLNGMFKVKDARLRELVMQIRLLEQEVGGEVTYTYIPRERNKRADLLVNCALEAAPHVPFA